MASDQEARGSRVIITVLGDDRPGIVAAVAGALCEREANILDISQTILQGIFTMTMLVDLEKADFSELKATLDVADLSLELTGSNTVATLTGKARYMRVYASGGRVGAAELETMSAEANATGSSRVVLQVTDRLEAKTSTGGVVTYKGNPAVVRTDEKFMGGSIAHEE